MAAGAGDDGGHGGVIVLATILAGQLASGCQRLDRSIRCVLSPPMAAAVVPAPPASASSRRRTTRVTPRRKTQATGRPAGPPTAVAITRHAATLVEIGDCTGLRTFLMSVGPVDAAQHAFAQCVGGPVAVDPGNGGSRSGY